MGDALTMLVKPPSPAHFASDRRRRRRRKKKRRRRREREKQREGKRNLRAVEREKL